MLGAAARIRSPAIGCWRMSAHSAASSGPRLCEDLVGHRDHAHVAQLGGADERRRAPRRRGRAGGRPRPRARRPRRRCVAALGQHLQRARRAPARVAARRRRLRAYMRSSARRSASAASLSPRPGATTSPYEAPIVNPSPCSLSAATARRDQRASSSSAPVDAAGRTRRRRAGRRGRAGDGVSARREALQQRVAGGVAEGVVVLLEAVEVEERERVRRAGGEGVIEVLHRARAGSAGSVSLSVIASRAGRRAAARRFSRSISSARGPAPTSERAAGQARSSSGLPCVRRGVHERARSRSLTAERDPARSPSPSPARRTVSRGVAG